MSTAPYPGADSFVKRDIKGCLGSEENHGNSWTLTWLTISWSSLTSCSRDPVLSSSCRWKAGDRASPATFNPEMLEGRTHTRQSLSPSWAQVSAYTQLDSLH